MQIFVCFTFEKYTVYYFFKNGKTLITNMKF